MTHDEARERILAQTVDSRLEGARHQLEAHLSSCLSCREYERQVERGLAGFRSQAVRTDPELLRRTQVALRSRAVRRRAREGWAIAAASVLACAGLAQWGALARGVGDWCGNTLGLPAWAAVACVTFLWLLPSALAAAALVAVGCQRPSGAGAAWWFEAMADDQGGRNGHA
jgi:predicted anti-sigma-YlaC factor YlaD